ncbi:PilZ domain-containing protein [Aurantiacibacter odishensis]|uniref:PilZ domain-containing protein n=1 Tax=Aurantiacibacter odishensis TaxID=1155476 RepID=UPI0013C49996|nr:PilZ domain-containing protein [Aurantiacibacter odishensis]
MHNALHQDEALPGAVIAGGGDIEQREATRYTLLIRAAKLLCDAGEFLCVIRDVSESGISVRTFHRLPPAARMVVELQNGDRHEMEPIWQKDDRAGFRFVHQADIDRIIVSPSRYAKRAIRLNLSAPAVIEKAGGRREDVEIVDLSQQGAKIACDCRFALDERVKLSAAGLPETNAKVRWRKDGGCGLIFEDTYQYGDFARIAADLQLGE